MSEQHRTKRLNEFKELENIENDQYLIGIDDIDIGNGARIKFDNFVNSCISSDENNKIILGTDNKLYNLSAINLYLEDMVYKSGDWVLGDVNGERNIYESLQDDNIGNALTDTSYWKKIDFGIEQRVVVLEEDIQNKADITTPSIQAPYLKTTYVSGASGYNIWSNGYCEQWGTCVASTSYSASNTVTLLKSYKDKSYNIMVGNMYGETNLNTFARFTGFRTNNQFGVCAGYGNVTFYSYAVFWRTYGYLAEGEY